MKSIIYFLFVSLAFYSCSKEEIVSSTEINCAFSYNSSAHPKNTELQNLLDDYVRIGVPGISVLIQDSSGVWVGSAGYADIAQGIKFSPCHISKAASITKFMVGTLTMKLQEEGYLDLDDPISNYIDQDILDKIENAEGKTIRQLMNHTTGIFDVITSNAFYLAVINYPNKRWSQDDLLPFVFAGDGVILDNPYAASYSNSNTLLLSMCIEKATGRSHAELLHDKILDPLGMDNTFYQGREEVPSSAAQGYFDLHNNGTIVNVSNFITGSGNGYGGIFSNVFDLDKFITAVLIDKTIVSQASLDEMLVFVQEDEDYFTGCGIVKKFTQKPTYGWGHTGRDLGYIADLFYFPEKGYKMIFFINYGTNGESSLKEVVLQFESDLVDVLLQ